MRMVRLFLITLCLATQSYSFATFTLSGNIITQTGIDSDLSGLSLLAGVNTTTQNDIIVYNIGDRRLLVNGTLSIDPETEMLIVGYFDANFIEVRGTLNIGRETTRNGVIRYSIGTAIYLENSPDGFIDRVRFYSTSTFNWNGGVISIYAGKFRFDENSSIRINSNNSQLIYRTFDPQNQIRGRTDDFITDGFSFLNGDFTIIGTNLQLNGYTPIHTTGALAFSVDTPNQDVVLRGYNGGDNGNDIDIKFWQGSRPILINSTTGSKLNAGPHIPGGTAYGVALIYQEFDFLAVKLDGSPIENAHYFIRDTDHGQRRNYNREGHLVTLTDDFVYTQATNAAGTTTVENILLGAVAVNTGSGSVINSGTYRWDYRGKNNDDSDLFDINIWAYDFNNSLASDIELKGEDKVSLRVILFDDPNTTKTEAEANSITDISITHNPSDASGTINITGNVTLCDVYDFAKVNKLSNLEEPSINSLTTQASGGIISIGDYQLVISATGILNPCDKFQKLNSNVVSNLDDPSTNLKIALTDPDGTYKLARLSGIDTANINVLNNADNSSILSELNYTGSLDFVITPTAGISDISISVTREGYSTWATDVDLTTDDIFIYPVVQSQNPLASNVCSLSNQELTLYLTRKILAKNQLIQTQLNNSTDPNITLNSISSPATDCSLEKQEEIILLMKRILSKTKAIQTQLNN